MIVVNPGGTSPFLLIGDHAGRAIPRRLGDLGVSARDLERHIACDIGVAGLGEAVAHRLDAAFIHQAYSRLVIDCNRSPDAADAVPAVSDGTAVPANANLSRRDLDARRREIAQPYQDAIAAALAGRARAGRPTLLVSLHSFTPVMGGLARPWRVGVLHRHDSPLSSRVLARLQARLGEEAGDNQPYAMDGTDYTVPRHARAFGLDYLELEVRQDLVGDALAQDEMADLVAEVLAER